MARLGTSHHPDRRAIDRPLPGRYQPFGRAALMMVVGLLLLLGLRLLLGHAATPAPAGHMGMNSLAIVSGNSTQVNATLSQMQSAGVDWVRGDFEWSAIEPAKGSYNWSHVQALVDGAASHKMQILGTIDYTPAWARSNQSSDKYPPDNVQDYANFVSAIVGKYKGSIHYWEIWNEPNNSTFWQPGPNAAAYTKLLKAAYGAAKAADPSATVVSGGLSPGSGSSDPRTFLQGIYNNNGGSSTGLFDAVGWHPYCDVINPATSTDSWCAWYQMSGTNPSARSIMAAAGDAGKLIWPTEYGTWTGGSGQTNVASQSTQAADLTAAYSFDRQTSWLGPLFWYDFQDSSNAKSDSWVDFMGLLDFGGNQKQSWAAYQAAAAGDGSGAVPGDLNGDGRVDGQDLAILTGHYNQSGSASQGDLTGDGRVTILDLALMAGHWGQ